MPAVPQYENPQVKSQDLTGISVRTGGVNAGAFGAIQGEQLQQVGKIADFATKQMLAQQEEKDVADAMDALNTVQQEAQAKRQELEMRAGKDAQGIQRELGDWHNTRQQEIAAGLNERSAKLFSRKADGLRLRDDDWAAGYEKQQIGIYYDVQMKTGIENAKMSALYNPTPEGINGSIREIRGYLQDTALRKGYDAAWIDDGVRDAEHGIHGAILQNAIDQDAVASVQSYISQFGDKIDPGIRGKAEKWAHNKVIDETAGAYADELISSGVGYAAALEQARERFSGDDEDKYVRRIKERYGEREEQKRMYVRDRVESFEKMAYDQGLDKLTDEQLDDVAAVDPGIAMRWKASRDEALEIKAAGGKPRANSDKEMLAELNSRLVTDEDNKITKPEQLEQYRPFLSASDYSAAEKRLDKNRSIGEDDIKQAYMIFAPENLKRKEQKKWTVEDWDNYNAFAKMASQSVKDTANPDYVGKLAAEWWLKGNVKGTGYMIGGKEYFADESTKGEAFVAGQGQQFIPTTEIPRNTITEPGIREDSRQSQFRPGQKVRQGGITYEYDGTNWNPVE